VPGPIPKIAGNYHCPAAWFGENAIELNKKL